LAPVSGTVTLDDKPLVGAAVTFLPIGTTKGRICYGVTDQNGRYELAMDGQYKGAPAGQFLVLCNKWVMPDGSDIPPDSKLSAVELGAKELLPPRYSQEETSELRATVPPNGGTFDFKLTSRP